MKKLHILLIVCLAAINSDYSYSQNDGFVDRWDIYTNPNTDNFYYHHFKKYIDTELITSNSFPYNSSKIVLEFNLDSVYEVKNIRVNTKNEKLKFAVLRAFKEIDFGKIAIKNASTLHNYSLQILAKENGVAVLKCSSSVLHEIPPILEGCEHKKNYEAYNKCFISNTEYYLETGFDTTNIPERSTSFYPKFYFNKNKKLTVINVKSNDSTLIEGAKKSIEGFNQRFRPAKLNGITDNYEVSLRLNSDHLGYANKLNNLGNASTENELAQYFKSKIPNSLLIKEPLNLKHNKITITYSYNKENQLENIKTSAKNKELDKIIKNAFKLFPPEKLMVSEKKLQDNYIFQVIFYENKRNVVKCTNPIIYHSLPIFNKSCEKSKTYVERLKCNQTDLQKHVKANFQINLAKGLEPGVKRIYVLFTISKTGDIGYIRARAPNEVLKNEAIRVIKKYKIKSPGYQFGKLVKIKYSLPIAFKVEGQQNRITETEMMKNRNPYKN